MVVTFTKTTSLRTDILGVPVVGWETVNVIEHIAVGIDVNTTCVTPAKKHVR